GEGATGLASRPRAAPGVSRRSPAERAATTARGGAAGRRRGMRLAGQPRKRRRDRCRAAARAKRAQHATTGAPSGGGCIPREGVCSRDRPSFRLLSHQTVTGCGGAGKMPAPRVFSVAQRAGIRFWFSENGNVVRKGGGAEVADFFQAGGAAMSEEEFEPNSH